MSPVENIYSSVKKVKKLLYKFLLNADNWWSLICTKVTEYLGIVITN